MSSRRKLGLHAAYLDDQKKISNLVHSSVYTDTQILKVILDQSFTTTDDGGFLPCLRYVQISMRKPQPYFST